MNKQDIILNTIKEFGTEEDINLEISERILDYVDSDWEEDGEYEDEYEWYKDFGRGEAEGDIHNDILQEISNKVDEPIEDWYFNNKYGDVDGMIFEVFPMLNV